MNPFTHAVDCCKAHGDIPRVQAAIQLLNAMLLRRLDALGRDVLERLVRRLESFDVLPGSASVRVLVDDPRARRETLQAILASLWQIVEQGFAQPFSLEVQENIQDAVEELLAAGAATFGVAPDTQVGLLRQAAEDELTLLLQGTVLEHRAQIEPLLTEFLTSAGARTELTALQEAAGDTIGGRAAWTVALGAILVPAAAQAATIDTWAYSWHNAGGFAAARRAGVRAFEVVSVLDGRETKFCRWAHGRIVPIRRVEEQLKARTEAALRGDRAGVIAAQPFIDSEVAKHGNAYQFERFFRRVGLAPYHFGCRTGARPVNFTAP